MVWPDRSGVPHSGGVLMRTALGDITSLVAIGLFLATLWLWASLIAGAL